MRRLGPIDLLVIIGLVVLLLLAARADFARFDGRTVARPAPAPPGSEAAR